ncbi:hypothetical protein MMPV_008749 [Pyropia vietnamensis]
MANMGGPVEGAAAPEGETAVSLARVLGPLPSFDQISAWEVVWARERARGWTTQTRAHQLMVDVDATYPGNTLRKQLALCPRALAPSARDRCTAQTYIRHSREIGYCGYYYSQANLVEMANVPWGPHATFLIREGPFLGGPEELVSYSSLASARHQRDRTGYFVAWHQAEFPAVPTNRRDRHYVRTPRWWGSVEVPFGALIELPPVVTYFRDLLIDGNAFAWAVFITEWTATTGAFLVDEYRRSSRLWLYPRRLAGWIRQLDSRHFCRGPDGLDEVAERELRALLNLLDTLNEEPGLHHRLAQLAGSERERAGWVRVGLVTEGDKTEARVAEDLSPLEIPYTEDVLRHRTFAVPPHRPAEAGPAVSALRGPPYYIPGSGGSSSAAAPPRRSSETGPVVSAPLGPPHHIPASSASTPAAAPRLVAPPTPRLRTGPMEGSPLVLVSNLSGHDIPASLLGSLSSPLPPAVAAALIPFLSHGDVDEPGPRVGSVVTGLLQAIVDLGEATTAWAMAETSVPVSIRQRLLAPFDRLTMRNELRVRVLAAERANERRAEAAQNRGRVRPREEAASAAEASDVSRDTRPRSDGPAS